MRISLAVAAAALVTTVAAAPASAATRSVRVGDNFFIRSAISGTPVLSVERNDTVAWRWTNTRSRHNVVVTRGPVTFRSRTMRSGTYRRKMTRRGTYTLVCTIHGAAVQSMRLRVR